MFTLDPIIGMISLALDFISDISSVVIWPLVVFILVLFLMFSKNGSRRISEIFRGFKSVKMFGAEFVLSEEGRQQAAQSARETFHTYRSQAKAEYDRLADVNNIREKLEQVISSVKVQREGKIIEIKKIENVRFTVHVPDAIFAETMYQLLDYYPKGGGRGRIWSVRYGILGKAWRLGKSLTQESVPTTEEELTRDWGMTREEATAAAQGRKSFSCVILYNKENTAVGAFYMDAPNEKDFGDMKPSELDIYHKNIISACGEDSGLIAGLDNISRELLARGPRINIYG